MLKIAFIAKLIQPKNVFTSVSMLFGLIFLGSVPGVLPWTTLQWAIGIVAIVGGILAIVSAIRVMRRRP